VYINDIPTPEFEKWLKIESTRFSELTLRLFHTELEAVYEEFNMGQDNDYRKVSETMDKLLFPNHPYGTQSTIGLGEHLKNPSMVKIHEYFDTYYVPNNMAICLAGDVPENAVELIAQYFGGMKSKALPVYESKKADAIATITESKVVGPMPEFLEIGYQLPGINNKDVLKAKMLEYILNNSESGLFDLNLTKKQKVLDIYCYAQPMKDYSSFTIHAEPKEGQTLEEMVPLIKEQLEKARNGEYDDWLIEAVCNDFEFQELDYKLDQNYFRVDKLVSLFIYDLPLESIVEEQKYLRSLTKKDITDFMNTYIKDNYVLIYKRQGESEDAYKVPKPKITPIEVKRDTMSSFVASIDTMPSMRLNPEFDDYTLVKETDIKPGLTFAYVKNAKNQLFDVNYRLEMGKFNNKLLPIAVNYLQFMGTDQYTADSLAKEFYKLGVKYYVYASNDNVYVGLKGLQRNFEKGVELLEHIINHAVADEESFTKYLDKIKKERSNQLTDKYTIAYDAIPNYLRYGSDNPSKYILTNAEVDKIQKESLADMIHQLPTYKHTISYYGPDEEAKVLEVFKSKHSTPDQLKDYPAQKNFDFITPSKPMVYVVDYDMVQTDINMFSTDVVWDKKLSPYTYVFNEFFGSGLSSIVFQEIRESKALAYSAYAYVSSPRWPNKPYGMNAYIGTQGDKMIDAINAMNVLLTDLPEAEDQFEKAKLAALKDIETQRSNPRNLYGNLIYNRRFGFTEDPSKEVYEGIKSLSFDKMKTYYAEHVKGKTYNYVVMGKKSSIDTKGLSKFGTVKVLEKTDLFNF
jgi:zinc protease